MNIAVRNRKFTSEELVKIANENLVNLEQTSREVPVNSTRLPIGFVLPLGTLGNAPNQTTQFKSNFHIVAYTIAEDLIDKEIDFEDFNIGEKQSEQGQIAKLIKRLDELSISMLGNGWRITLFNVKISTAIESMCKGNNDIDSMKQAIDNLYSIINNRLILLSNTVDGSPLEHELIELFYTPLTAISNSFTKVMEKSKSVQQSSICNSILIETLVYDKFANGLRLISNIESFASSKIRQYNSEDGSIYLFVLKARIYGEDTEFRPIRQFSGKSKISTDTKISGCSERIVYNLVNKNYRHWSFISIPSKLRIELLTQN